MVQDSHRSKEKAKDGWVKNCKQVQSNQEQADINKQPRKEDLSVTLLILYTTPMILQYLQKETYGEKWSFTYHKNVSKKEM